MRKDWVVVLVVTFIAFVVWVASDIYHAKPGVQITPKLQEALEPLDPNFDQPTLDLIEHIDATK